jgi:cellulose synthase/poly-beta-1,6-N-acetylglucosamine synthase-like glycosyltransferase
MLQQPAAPVSKEQLIEENKRLKKQKKYLWRTVAALTATTIAGFIYWLIDIIIITQPLHVQPVEQVVVDSGYSTYESTLLNTTKSNIIAYKEADIKAYYNATFDKIINRSGIPTSGAQKWGVAFYPIIKNDSLDIAVAPCIFDTVHMPNGTIKDTVYHFFKSPQKYRALGKGEGIKFYDFSHLEP